MPKTEDEDFSLALRRARSALDMLAQLRIPPTPKRMAVAFLHQTGETEEMSAAINRLLSRDKLTTAAIDELHQQYLGRFLEEGELRDASRRIGRTVAEVANYLDTANDSAERYGQVLAGFEGSASELQEGSGGPDLRVVAKLSQAIDTVLTETRQMAETNSMLEDRLLLSAREIELLREHLDLLQREAGLDGLTGIANRKNFDIMLREAIALASRERQPLCLLMIDIDHFKQFNDAHGHQMGDKVLKLVARSMKESVKGRDTVARYGGEEFVVVLPQTVLEAALQVAEVIRRHVSTKKIINRRTGSILGQITLSIGVAQHRPGEHAGELVHRADEALYLAKSTGRNKISSEIDLARQ